MKPTLKTSPSGRKLIKSFEGLRRKAAPLPGGGWVIGYGHTRSAREGAEITADDADKLLIYDLLPVEAAINENVQIALTQNQFDALASLTLNIGRDNFLNSTVLKRLNENKPLEAALAFDQWRASVIDGKSVVVEALLRRRASERALFLTPSAAASVPAAPAVEAAPPAPASAAPVAPAAALPFMNFRAAPTGFIAGRFELIAPPALPASETSQVTELPAPQRDTALEPETQIEPEAIEPAQATPAPEDNDDEPALAPEAADAALAPAEQALDDAPVFEPEAAEAPAAPPAFTPALGRIEDAMAQDEAIEEVFVAPIETPDDSDQDARDDHDDDRAEEIDPPFVSSIGQSDPAPERENWAMMARERAKLARERTPALPPEARREDLLVRNTEAEWSVEDEQDYAPTRERGAIWHALFLLIGVTLAGFGSWDTWQRATGKVEEAFVYGPAVAAFGVLFMAIAGWFLIKRVLAFR